MKWRGKTDGALAEMVTKASCKMHRDNREITLSGHWMVLRDDC